ncbi:winged helix DNA-binding protein [Hydrogenophaga sp. BPS33]|uniref:winged helix DNA-binding protein n=1 Tax=Hydrogenophaga sp. BPS33 TaxID=2651974 RepID=UPI00131F91D1|nr:winged helix DNA-binding protein [Hydrogenophaga sp. BPS33]QHE86628.1 winged helix DNA-binding protein [Hydrogenophaga sp. BPS33]
MPKPKSSKRLVAATAPSGGSGAAEFQPNAVSRDLSDFEYALITLMFGFQTWSENCLDAADFRGLKSLDILVLHAVNHRARRRRLNEVCMVMNISDTHLVAYALKKLIAADLVAVHLQGRERVFEATAKGEEACLAYRKVREQYLVPGVDWIADVSQRSKQAANFMQAMTALYAQAGRIATAETAGNPKSPPLHTKR